MNTTDLVKYAGPLIALAICSACGGGSVVAPSNAALNGGTTAARPYLSRLPGYPTIVPDRRTNSKTFEYIINNRKLRQHFRLSDKRSAGRQDH